MTTRGPRTLLPQHGWARPHGRDGEAERESAGEAAHMRVSKERGPRAPVRQNASTPARSRACVPARSAAARVDDEERPSAPGSRRKGGELATSSWLAATEDKDGRTLSFLVGWQEERETRDKGGENKIKEKREENKKEKKKIKGILVILLLYLRGEAVLPNGPKSCFISPN